MELALRQIQLDLFESLKSIRNARIKQHLRRVESSLRKNPPSNFSHQQLIARNKTLDLLHQYWQVGAFPINDQYTRTTPIFKDRFGNYCAVGYLLSASGYDNYVTEIQTQNNQIRVKEISDSKYLQAIAALGITKVEAARIQPSYGFEDPDSGEPIVSFLKLAAVVVYILLQVSAYYFIKEMNLSKVQKISSYFSIFLFSSLVMVGVWSLLILISEALNY